MAPDNFLRGSNDLALSRLGRTRKNGRADGYRGFLALNTALNSISDTFTIILDRNVADLIYFLKFNDPKFHFALLHWPR